MKRILSSKSGFTLVELALSMAILLIVVGPLAGYFIASSANNNRANLQLEANQLAEQYMEEWKRSGRVQLNSSTGAIVPLAAVENANHTLVIERVAIAQIKTIEKSGGPESAVPTQKPDPYAETKVTLPTPVPEASAIENYNIDNSTIAAALGGDFTASYILEGETVRDSNSIDLPITSSNVVISQGANVLSVKYGATEKHPTTNSQVSLVFQCNSDSPRAINVVASQIPMKIYLVRGLKADNKPFPEPTVSVASGLNNVQVYKNLIQQPTTVDGQRLYRLNVTVKRKGAATSEPNLVTLTSYMRTK